MESKQLKIGGKSYRLQIGDFGEEIEVEDLLKIDYSNLVGEMVTFPIILNRLGIMLADVESIVAEKKLSLDVNEAKIREKYEEEFLLEGKKPTVDKLNTAMSLDKIYQTFKKAHIESIKNRDYVNSIYWAAKDKSGKLDKLSLSLQAGDISDYILEGKVNNINISKSKRLID